jgi:hypothetical protein
MTVQTEEHPTPAGLLLRYLSEDRFPEQIRPLGITFRRLGEQATGTLQPGPELTMGLRKLVEAQDCFIRASEQLLP